MNNNFEIPEDDSYHDSEIENTKNTGINVLRRHIKSNPKKKELARHKLWMDSIQHEYPMPYFPYKIGVYIRYYNQTKYDNYLEKHKLQFRDDIALCPAWKLVDFYIDNGMTAPRMENSKNWCRLLEDCLLGKVDLIVTQKVSNVSSNPQEISFVASLLAAQKHPIGMYFISEDIFTLASYYTAEIYDENFLATEWEILPDDEFDKYEPEYDSDILRLSDNNPESDKF